VPCSGCGWPPSSRGRGGSSALGGSGDVACIEAKAGFAALHAPRRRIARVSRRLLVPVFGDRHPVGELDREIATHPAQQRLDAGDHPGLQAVIEGAVHRIVGSGDPRPLVAKAPARFQRGRVPAAKPVRRAHRVHHVGPGRGVCDPPDAREVRAGAATARRIAVERHALVVPREAFAAVPAAGIGRGPEASSRASIHTSPRRRRTRSASPVSRRGPRCCGPSRSPLRPA